jgi:hypothetical protein
LTQSKSIPSLFVSLPTAFASLQGSEGALPVPHPDEKIVIR